MDSVVDSDDGITAVWYQYDWSKGLDYNTICVVYLQLEQKKQTEKMQRDSLNDQYLDLVEKQRLYFKTVRDFKEVIYVTVLW